MYENLAISGGYIFLYSIISKGLDPRSKGMLTFLMILFSLAETGVPVQAPLVTIPAG